MANYPQYKYDESDTELYKTNLYGGTDADIGNTEVFTSTINNTELVFAVVDIKFTGSGSTDDLGVNVYRRRDSTWDGDEIPIDSIILENDGTEGIFSYVIGDSHGPGYYRIGLATSGGTDTFDADIEMRQARYEIATT